MVRIMGVALAAAALAAFGCSSGTASRRPSTQAGPMMLTGTTRVVEPRTLSAGALSDGGPAVGVDSDGRVVTSNDFRGRVVVLDFWATWCAPCKASSPAFQALSDRFAGDPRVMTLAVHTDNSGDPKAYMRENRYTFRMVPRGQEFARAYDVRVLPTFIVLDQRGREIYRDTGMMGECPRQEVERLVRSQLR